MSAGACRASYAHAPQSAVAECRVHVEEYKKCWRGRVLRNGEYFLEVRRGGDPGRENNNRKERQRQPICEDDFEQKGKGLRVSAKGQLDKFRPKISSTRKRAHSELYTSQFFLLLGGEALELRIAAHFRREGKVRRRSGRRLSRGSRDSNTTSDGSRSDGNRVRESSEPRVHRVVGGEVGTTTDAPTELVCDRGRVSSTSLVLTLSRLTLAWDPVRPLVQRAVVKVDRPRPRGKRFPSGSDLERDSRRMYSSRVGIVRGGTRVVSVFLYPVVLLVDHVLTLSRPQVSLRSAT